MTITLIIFLFGFTLIRHRFYWEAKETNLFDKHKVIYMAHRGESKFYPENTIEAYAAAIEGGFEWVELDIMLSLDKEIVCSHNYDLEKETDGEGLISDTDYFTLDDIKTGKYSHPHNQKKMPLLKNVLIEMPTKAKYNIEIKTKSLFDFETSKRLIGVLKDVSPGRFMVSSFNPAVIVYFKIFHPGVPLGFLIKGWEWFWLVNWIHPSFINPRADMITKDFLKFSKKRNLSILTWTIDNIPSLEWCQRLEVQGVITDLSGDIIYERD